jgi:NAD(P)H-flavin reductase
MLETNPYCPVESMVVGAKSETPTIRTLFLRPDQPVGFRPGQFVELTVPGVGEAPFTPSGDWTNPELIEVTVMRVGRVTERIHQLRDGDTVGLRGPFGRGYQLDDFRGRQVLVVGGGCGFAPLRSLMYAFFQISSDLECLIFRGGCRSPSELLYRSEMEQWGKRDDLDLRLTVDVGDETWQGPVGLVTTLLDDLKLDTRRARSVVCGPPVMMKHTTYKLLDLGFPGENIYLSMEKNMSCGLGLCGHCRLDRYYCCVDGPVFRYSEIRTAHHLWD